MKKEEEEKEQKKLYSLTFKKMRYSLRKIDFFKHFSFSRSKQTFQNFLSL